MKVEEWKTLKPADKEVLTNLLAIRGSLITIIKHLEILNKMRKVKK
jgi:hypothetical protein